MYRRRLPHVTEAHAPVFITWRLAGSLPPNRAFPCETLTSGRAFVAMDRLLDSGIFGPTYLSNPEIAAMVVEAIQFGQDSLGHYEWHSFVVMPNHVHLLATPRVPIPKLLHSIKSITAKRANELLRRAGPFWQQESFARTLRAGQFERVRAYIENNPVKAGLARSPEEFRWSSA